MYIYIYTYIGIIHIHVYIYNIYLSIYIRISFSFSFSLSLLAFSFSLSLSLSLSPSISVCAWGCVTALNHIHSIQNIFAWVSRPQGERGAHTFLYTLQGKGAPALYRELCRGKGYTHLLVNLAGRR